MQAFARSMIVAGAWTLAALTVPSSVSAQDLPDMPPIVAGPNPSAPVPPVIGSIKPWYQNLVGIANPTASPLPVAETIVQDPNAAFIQVELDNATLPQGAYVELTSLADGDQQHITPQSFDAGVAQSAYFNSPALRVRLFAGAYGAAPSFRIKTIGAGFPGIGPDSICGTADNRVASSRRSCCRLILRIGTSISWCSGWLVSSTSSGHATAGHCLSGVSSVTAQYNVPLSTSSGALVNPPAADQYAWRSTTRIFSNGGLGNDWGVFKVTGNPFTRQGAFFTTSSANPNGITATVEGFGSDSGTANATEQKHSGRVNSVSGNIAYYSIDTTGGNSGSPVYNSAGQAVAVHTNGGCTTTGGNNSGTRVSNASFANALNTIRQ